jgi:hypothetical protein
MPTNQNSVFTARFNMVMLPEERAKLQELAKDLKQRESALVREWISAAYDERFGKKKPGRPAPKYNSLEAREAKAKRAKK